MGFDFALDELYASGWSGLDTSGCSHHSDGRAFPRPDRVKQEFAAAGVELKIEHVGAFNCYRAHWTDPETGDPRTVVGYSEAEAAVYALAQFRRQMVVNA